MTIKATATRAEKKVHTMIEKCRFFTGERPISLHITATDYDALEATGKLHSFGVELIRI